MIKLSLLWSTSVTTRKKKNFRWIGIKVWRNLNNAYCQSGMSWSENSDFSRLYTGTNAMTFGAYMGYMESHDEERVGYKVLTLR